MSGPSPHWGTVWITGASSGIGRELARQIAPQAAHVAISARTESALLALEQDLNGVSAYPTDVTKGEDVAACVEQIEAKHGAIDLAVLNAGYWKLMPADDLDLVAMERAIEVNYLGVVRGLTAVLPSMLRRGSGHIAIVASVAGYRGLPNSAGYGPTKAALINLAESLKVELAPKGITISIVNPGFVDTPMTRNNPFPMPGIISASQAATAMLVGLKWQRYEIIFPKPFGFAMKALRLLPNALYFWLATKFILNNPGQSRTNL